MNWVKRFLLENAKALVEQGEASLRGTMPGIGWLLPAGMLLGKAVQKIAGRQSDKKKGKAINAAEEEKKQAAQKNRVARLGMLQSMLGGVQKGLAGGRYGADSGGGGYTGGTGGTPDYTLDPAALKLMQEAPAYVKAPDAAAGQGWSMIGDLAGVGSEAAETAMIGQQQNDFDALLAKARGPRGAGMPGGGGCVNGVSTTDGGPC